MKKIFVSMALVVFTAGAGMAQEKIPFWNEVQQLKKKDSAAFPAAGQVLFIGSSSFTKWTDVSNYFPKYKILNRAFGGSTLLDLIQFRYDVIYPYAPKQIVMYCGENDFASSDTVTVSVVMQRFKTLYALIRAKYPAVPFLYVSMKPSPSRVRLLEKYKEANAQIAAFLKTEKKTAFADVYSKMMKADGTVMDDIFIHDNLHMNAKGYKIWQGVLLSYLLK